MFKKIKMANVSVHDAPRMSQHLYKLRSHGSPSSPQSHGSPSTPQSTSFHSSEVTEIIAQQATVTPTKKRKLDYSSETKGNRRSPRATKGLRLPERVNQPNNENETGVKTDRDLAAKSNDLTEEERIEIWNTLQNYQENGMKVTSWGLCAADFEIYYILEKHAKFDEQAAIDWMQKNVTLQPALRQREIKLVKLKCKPQYKATSGPGSKIEKSTDMDGVGSRIGSLGAFVEIRGRGIHVLQSGHDKKVGEKLRLEKTHKSLGEVKVVLLGNSVRQNYRDFALTQLPPGIGGVRPMNIVWNPAPHRILSRVIAAPKAGAAIMKFSKPISQMEMGNIYHSLFCANIDNVILQNCVTAVMSTRGNRSERKSFHVDGESGTLATTIPVQSNPNEVQPIMMLVGKITMNEEINGNTEMSVGVSMQTILEELASDSYCKCIVEIV